MARYRLMCALAVLAAGSVFPLAAQQPQPAPVGAPRTKAPRAPGAPTGKTLVLHPAQPAAAVTQQATVTPAAAPSNAFTAGLGVPPFGAGGEAARIEYLRTIARNLDSASVVLIGIYRNTSGQPMSGASSPTTLSARERDRWARCRDVYWDFTTFAAGVHSAGDGLAAAPALQRAVAALDSALASLDALAECDNLASMITAPDRWDPWAQQYTNAAHHFYTDWYSEVRDAHERDRALVVALNALLPAGRTLPVPPGLPHNPPYAGAEIR